MANKVIASGTVDLLLGSDHRGLKLKEYVTDWLMQDVSPINFAMMYDVGTYNDKRCDYPDIVKKFANEFDIYSFGVLICGSGFGVSIAANRFDGIRAVVCRTIQEATMARKHNNANVLCLGSDYTMQLPAFDIIKAFVETDFEKGRHQKRVNMLKRLNK